MCLQKSARIFLFITILAVLAGCGMDAILPSTGTYKINAKIKDASLDDFSLVSSKDKIQPFFEEPVSEDPDITELVVFLKDTRGVVTGYKVTYSLTYSDKDNNKESETELQPKQDDSKTDSKTDTKTETKTETEKKTGEGSTTTTATTTKTGEEKKDAVPEKIDIPNNVEYVKKDNEIIFPVKSLDDALPFLPLPSDLPIGKYTMVFQVLSKNTILFKYEKPLFYLADAELSFDGIQVNLPGVAESSQFIQNGNTILLDIDLEYDSRLEPYVVWYNGKKIIDEGLVSDGAGSLLWKAPEQNGFVSLRAEVFPSWEKTGLVGYQKGISLLVSSKEIDMHLLSEETPSLVQWYIFEGALNDSAAKDSEEKAIESVGKNKPVWMPANGTYGLASGLDNSFRLPNIPTNNGDENWQIITRFKPLSEGEIFSVQPAGASGVTMTLSKKKSNLVLTLVSSSKAYSESLRLPDERDSFVTVSVKFIIQSGRLSAKMAFVKPSNVKDYINKNEPVINPISMEADSDKEINITLGQPRKTTADNQQTAEEQKPSFTAIWDEFAILRLPSSVEIIVKKDAKAAPAEEAPADEEEQQETIIPHSPPITTSQPQ